MMQVHLKQLKLYGYHGLDKGEDVLGGEYEVSLTASYTSTEVPLVSIGHRFIRVGNEKSIVGTKL